MTSAYLAWSNREIPIIVETPSSTEGVQTRMKIHYLSGMAADGKDFRFSSVNGSPLNYWIESIADNIYNVYIKLPANESTIYFYYGNNSATSESSGENTFELFESWDGGSVDTSKWNTATYGNGSITQGLGKVVLSATAGYASLTSKTSFNYPIKIRHLLTVDSVAVGSRHRFTIPISQDVGMFEGKMFFGSESTTGYQQGRGYNIYERIYPSEYFDIQLLNNPEDTGVYSNSTSSGVSSGANSVVLTVGDSNSTTQSGAMSIYITTVSKDVATPPTLKFDFTGWKKQWNKINVIAPNTTNWVQSKLKLSLLSGMNTAGDDLRFTDVYGNSLSYWIETIKNKTFTIWIKLPANDKSIYLHYGNPAATPISSGSNTFDFFDEFTGTSLDTTTKWQGGAGYTVTGGELVLTGTGAQAWISSKNSFTAPFVLEYVGRITARTNNINLGCHIHKSNNTQIIGTATGYLCSDMDNTNGNGFQLYKKDGVAWYSLANPVFNSVVGEYYNVKVVAKSDGISQYVYPDDRSTQLQTATTTDVTYTSGYIGFDIVGTGVSKINYIFIRKYAATEPRLEIVYNLESLDPISFEITSNINSAYTQLTARFATNLVPHERERIVCYADGTDVTNKIMFFGRVLSNTPTLSSFGNELQMVAADDMVALTQQNILWYFLGYRTEDVGDLINSVTYDNDLWVGTVSSRTLPNVVFNFDPTNSRYDVLKKVLDYFGFIFTPGYSYSTYYDSMLIEVVNACLPLDIDTASGFGMPAPLEFSWPSPYIVDKPTVGDTGENCNRVTVYGKITSTGLQTVSTAVTDEIVSCSDIADATIGLIYANIAKDDRIKDDRIEEKGSTAEIEAIKWLLYNNTKRATVKFKLVGMIGIELYQRIRFGTGFPDELTELTNQKQLKYVWAGNPSNHFDYTDFHTVDVSGVPMPSWLRVTGISYKGEDGSTYLEVEAVTDFIYSSSDPTVPAPYNNYINIGMMKPIVSDSVGVIKSIVDATIKKAGLV